MLMTPLLSKGQNVGLNFCNTSTQLTLKYSSLQRNLTPMDLYPFWVCLIHYVQWCIIKLNHTDQYLHWDSHHNLFAKLSMFDTITHRGRTVCAKPQLLQTEEESIKGAIQKCKFQNWVVNKKSTSW